MRQICTSILFTSVLLWSACGPKTSGTGVPCEQSECGVNGWQECRGGEFQAPVTCAAEQVCLTEIGCAVCIPDAIFCVENSVQMCNADGTGGTPIEACEGDQVCSSSGCVSACDKAVEERSNVGCEYWAVDLDNEYSQFNDAAGEQFAVALANASNFPVDVTIEQNDALPGQPTSLSVVTTARIMPNSLEVINLPRREVDGSVQGTNDGPGTMLSSNAYRITTNYPVVAYQFNPIIQSFSNGASLLIPTSGLDEEYLVLGWSTANPIAPIPIPGIPDHSYVTVVGVSDNPVTVDVTLGGDILGGGGIPATSQGGTVSVELGPFDVLNLESTGIPGDLSGSRVTANGPVAVFSGGERAVVPVDVMPPPPADWNGDTCCTEHFEQQVFPVTALGSTFVMTRSPIRSGNPNNPEGDVYRVMGTKPNTVVTTNLPAPYDTFTVGVAEYFEFWSITDFVLEASDPVIVGQYLVSQDYVESPSVGGDPEFILYPTNEQYRTDYIFLVPSTFDRDYAVIAAPENTTVRLDGENINDEFNPLCERFPAGFLSGVDYVALRCELTDGVHTINADMPVGVTVFGYYNVGSYGYAAGADLRRINVE